MLVLVGHVHTSEGHAALERAVAEARIRDAQLQVLRVLREPTTDDPTQHRDWHAAVEQARREAAELQIELAAEVPEVSCQVQLVRDQTPAEALLAAQRRLEADLLVIGLRTRSRVGKLLLGSAAQELLLGADCPVLAVKASGVAVEA